MKISSFDKKTARIVSSRIMSQLKSLEDELGIKFNYKGGRFSNESCTFKIEAAVLNSDGTVMTKEMQDLKTYGKMHGLTDEMLAKPVKLAANDDNYMLIGYRPRATKHPFIAKRVKDGKEYVFGVNSVLRGYSV